MKNFTLNDGNTIPALGFGTYKATEEDAIQSVKDALRNGYRLVDTAMIYQNEVAVGKGIKESGVPREEIYVTTKLWREGLSYENTFKELEASLERLQLDYIDLYLIHWPANEKNYGDKWVKANAEAWRAMEELQAQGKIKSIGVSNFWEEHLNALLKTAKVMPALNQIEFHPGYWQPELTQFCKDKGILVESWSPLARGKVFENELLNDIAKAHQKSVSQVCLRWVLQHEVCVIPKSTTLARIQENLEVFDFELSADEMRAINDIPKMGFSGELPNEWPNRV